MIKKILIFAIVLSFPLYTNAATFIVGGGQDTAQKGEELEVVVGVDTQGEKLNLFKVEVGIPKNLEVVSINKDNSAVNLWVKEPVLDKETGTVSFIGGVPGGLLGRVGFVKLIIKSDKIGEYPLSISSSSEAYLNDGLGTKIPMEFDGMVIQVGGGVKEAGSNAWLLIIPVVLGVVAFIVLKRKRK